jgi:ribonuclease HI
MITYYTDGSCAPTNPGPGGYAVIEDGVPVALGKAEQSTNIRMEGMAILTAIREANGRECIIYSDSEFWINVLTKWAHGWYSRGWKKSSGGPIANLDLVKELYAAYRETANKVKLQWVKGHADDPGNIAADEWANKARLGATIGMD